jgi:hypothetical protein
MEITTDLVTKLLTTVDAGLCSGLGNPEPGEMCIEAAVCYAMGLPHGDEPTCVGSAVRDFKIRLNDSLWSSNSARAKGLRKLAVAQLGSIDIDQQAFSDYVVEQTIRRVIPKLFRELGICPEKADACEKDEDYKAAAAAAANASYAAAVANAAPSHSWSIASYTAANASAAADAAAANAASAAAAAAADADAAGAEFALIDLAEWIRADAAANAATDVYLLLSAEIGLEALIICKSPGCEFLHLCDKI